MLLVFEAFDPPILRPLPQAHLEAIDPTEMEDPDQFNAVFVSNVLRIPIDRDRSGLAVRPVWTLLRPGGSVKMRTFAADKSLPP
jgi:hypothetical protein